MAQPQQPGGGLGLGDLVLRGGLMQLADVLDAFSSHYDHHHNPDTGACDPDGGRHFCYAMSVNCIPGVSAHDLAVAAGRPNPMARLSDVARVVGLGWILDPTPNRADGHTDLYLPGPSALLPTQEQAEALILLFDEPVPNAGRLK